MTTADQQLENLIKAEGLTAPRVTLEDLNSNIRHVEYVKYVSVSGKVLRWAVVTVANGYAVTGDPSCSASVTNDNAEVGERVAYGNARRSLWALMGYALHEKGLAVLRAGEGGVIPNDGNLV